MDTAPLRGYRGRDVCDGYSVQARVLAPHCGLIDLLLRVVWLPMYRGSFGTSACSCQDSNMRCLCRTELGCHIMIIECPRDHRTRVCLRHGPLCWTPAPGVWLVIAAAGCARTPSSSPCTRLVLLQWAPCLHKCASSDAAHDVPALWCATGWLHVLQWHCNKCIDYVLPGGASDWQDFLHI
jgi:hypothetical protein